MLHAKYDQSALCSSSTPSMCSKNVPNGSYGSASYSLHITAEVSLVDVAGSEANDTFRVARFFLGYAKKVVSV